MTGFGSATLEEGPRRVAVEVRTLNHRYLKLNLKLPRTLAGLESELEPVVRKQVRRGALTAMIRYRDDSAQPSFQIDVAAARAYRDQISKLWEALGLKEPGWHDRVEPLLALPGVVRADEEEDLSPGIPDETRSLVRRALGEALEALVASRAEEGGNTVSVLLAHAKNLEGHIAIVAARAPEIPREQRDRIHQRVQTLISEIDPKIEIAEADLVRELCVLVDKTDVAEELNRLQSHLERYRSILGGSGEAGRKLDFLIQEMLRETNTIGSKANDPTVAHAVVDMKCEVERMKEQVQNLE
jgi:uncharacterized protein (TIGR00255 family)